MSCVTLRMVLWMIALVLFAQIFRRACHVHQVPAAIQKALRALDRIVRPRRDLFKVADEHDIKTHRVCAVGFHDIVGVDDIAQRLRHLDRRAQRLAAVLFNERLLFLLGGDIAHIVGVLTENHTVARALGIRLLGVDDADVVQELVPEAGVQQMQRCVLHAAVVPVDRSPVLLGFLGDRRPCHCAGPYSAG